MQRFVLGIFYLVILFLGVVNGEPFKILPLGQPGMFKVESPYPSRLACVDADPLQDLLLVREDTAEVWLNRGNGRLSEKADLKLGLSFRPDSIKVVRGSDGLATLRTYGRGRTADYPLGRLLMMHRRWMGKRFNKANGDSLDFTQVWSWDFPINEGNWPVAAGDIDNDGRMELISSMTDTATIVHGWLLIFENAGDNTYVPDVTIELNYHAWFHQIKITDWDQDGHKELTCAVGFEIRMWEFYGDKNYIYLDTNIDFGGMVGCKGIEVVNTDGDSLLELLTIFTESGVTWQTRIELWEFVMKAPYQNATIWNSKAVRWETPRYYSFAAGDLDNDGWMDMLLGYGQLWPPSPNTLYYLEYNPNTQEFEPRYFQHPYPIDPSYCYIGDIDQDGLNEGYITGVGGGYGGMLYLKSTSPDNYQILCVDSTLYEAAGSMVKLEYIDGRPYIVKACEHHVSPYTYYYINISRKQLDNSFISLWRSPYHELESYIHEFQVLDMDGDNKEDIVYKTISYYGTHLIDHEKTTVSGLEPPTAVLDGFVLLGNYPNPFNSGTVIEFETDRVSKWDFRIYDVLGREVYRQQDITGHPGRNRIKWDGKDRQGKAVGSGLYLYRLNDGLYQSTGKMLLLR